MGRARPCPADLRQLAAARSPLPVRRWIRRHGLRRLPTRPWLSAAAEREFEETYLRHVTREPLRWDRMLLTTWWRSRYLRLATSSLDAAAAMYGVQALHPLTSAEFLVAVAVDGGRCGFPARSAALQALIPGLLPDDVFVRGTKASFGGAFWNDASREFAATWDGAGAGAYPVDVAALRRTWAQDQVDARSYGLLQGIWHAGELGI